MTSPTANRQRRSPTWAAYAACVWAWLFAAMSFYWAAGGTVGLATLGRTIERLALMRDPVMVAVGGWGAGIAKVIGGLLALALVRPWGRGIPPRILRAAVWLAGILLALYGAANLIQHGLMVARLIRVPDGLGETAASWHLFFWDPFWLLGGILFLLAARHSSRV